MRFKKMQRLDIVADSIRVYIRKFDQRPSTIEVFEQEAADIVDSLYKAVLTLDTGEKVVYVVWIKEAAIVSHWEEEK